MNESWFRFSVHPAFRKAEPQPFSMRSLVRTAKPNFGATYKPENARLIPATPEGYAHHENGIYTHPDEGTHFVKKAMVHPDGPYGANNGANPHDLTRREYTAHKLYSYFSSPTNGILPVEAKLINGSGVEAPSGHQWKPDEPAWLVTRAASTKAGPSREVYGFDPRTANLAQGEADPEAMKATLHNLSRGAVVDAVLGSDKPWGTDIHAGSGNEGVFRIDVGGRLGIPSPFNEHDTATKTPQEYMEKRAPFFNPQTDVLQRTAEFLGGISQDLIPEKIGDYPACTAMEEAPLQRNRKHGGNPWDMPFLASMRKWHSGCRIIPMHSEMPFSTILIPNCCMEQFIIGLPHWDRNCLRGKTILKDWDCT